MLFVFYFRSADRVHRLAETRKEARNLAFLAFAHELFAARIILEAPQAVYELPAGLEAMPQRVYGA
jgi:hypothetical protein